MKKKILLSLVALALGMQASDKTKERNEKKAVEQGAKKDLTVYIPDSPASRQGDEALFARLLALKNLPIGSSPVSATLSSPHSSGPGSTASSALSSAVNSPSAAGEEGKKEDEGQEK